MFRSTMLGFWALLALSILSACGNAAAPATLTPSQSPATPAPPPAAAAISSPAAIQPASTVAAQPIASASAAQSTAPPAVDRNIPEGTTAEGYHTLGRDDAPVTLTMYSDFL